jgi:hypothetical protein
MKSPVASAVIPKRALEAMPCPTPMWDMGQPCGTSVWDTCVDIHRIHHRLENCDPRNRCEPLDTFLVVLHQGFLNTIRLWYPDPILLGHAPEGVESWGMEHLIPEPDQMSEVV